MRIVKLAHYVQSLILVLFSASSYAVTAGSEPSTGVASEFMLNNPDTEHNKASAANDPQRVRIPVSIKAWTTVTATDGNAKGRPTRIATKPMSQVLRARMERPNDFYLGDWRVQTVPVRWLKRTGQYQVRLELFQRLGEAGQIEDSMGSVLLSGVLSKQADGLFVIQGKARRQFFDKHGNPIAEIQAGQATDETHAPAISRR